jgi:hypothetical protein
VLIVRSTPARLMVDAAERIPAGRAVGAAAAG